MKKTSVRQRKMISFLVSVLITFLAIIPVSAGAAAISSNDGKLMILVDSADSFDISKIQPNETECVFVDSGTLDYSALSGYAAYAVPYQLAANDKRLVKIIRNAFSKNNARIYIYGEFTISDFKKILNISQFGAEVSVYDKDGPTDQTAFLGFSEEQEQTCIENLISYSKSGLQKNMIATVRQGENVVEEYISIILEDYDGSAIMPMAMIVKSGFNYRSYLTSSAYANMDFLLYRDYDEEDPNYDYFAIKTNICTTGQLTARIQAEHRLPYDSDELIDYGPGDITRASSVSVGLDLGSGYGGGSLSYSFDVGGGPTINASYYAGDDYCTWDISRYWWFGGDLVNELFCLGSSWASTGTYAATNVKFRAEFDVIYDYIYSPWCEVQVRYDY